MSKVYRIAFCGAAGSGKTTHARLMQKHYGGDVLSFATPLKQLAESYYPAELLADPHVRRQVLQDLGSTMRKYDPLVFIRKAEAKLPKTRSVYVDDLRYLNEYNMLRRQGFVVIRLVAPLLVLQDRRPGMDTQQLMHESETENLYFTADLTVATDVAPAEDIHDFIARFIDERAA